MLTVRLLAADGAWVWVNTVMHVRQPYLCENGDPAIVCINQVSFRAPWRCRLARRAAERAIRVRYPSPLDGTRKRISDNLFVTSIDLHLNFFDLLDLQIISDSEAALFKMQSQLESSHIARSPEFLDPIQGGVAPSHIITQVRACVEVCVQNCVHCVRLWLQDWSS